MPSSKLILAVCCLLLGATANAQITITENDIPRTIGDSFRFKITAIDTAIVNVGPAGGPQAWTFDTAAFSGMVIGTEMVNRDSAPFGDRFPDANITVQEIVEPFGLWVYRKLEADQMLDLGRVMKDADTIYGFNFSPPGVNLDLPLTFGTAWQTAFGYTDTTSDTTQTVVLDNYDCRVDAWGTASCPGGTYPCLRLNVFQTEISADYLRGEVYFADTVLSRCFYWYGPAVGAVATATSMPGDTSSTFTVAFDYNVLVWANCGAVLEQRSLAVAPAVRVLPNPCRGSAKLNLASGITGPFVVRVCDAAGRVVLRRTASSGEMRLNLRGNRPGVYVCTVTAGGRTLTNELVLLR